ncbi:MAG: hypothetical protein RR365_01080 [Bacteroides sp.]
MSLIIDKRKDYYRACKGFYINGNKFVRLLGTTGGVKNSTIVFVSERIADFDRKRIDNGRDLTKELVPAKFEAYRALTCSGSTPVSFPRGILVVNDCITEFFSDIVEITERDEGEPVMTPKTGASVKLNCCDGCGMISPKLAERWSMELGLKYMSCGFNTRYAWEKGMVFAFDFHEFARDVAKANMVEDAWGNVVDINNVELVLTTSMLKLWDSYSSCEEYLDCCFKNNYEFAVTKTCPEMLDNEHSLNYQFLQSYELSDADIEELISPTIQEFKDVLSGDVMKTILFMKGTCLDENSFNAMDDDQIKGLLVDPSLLEDYSVRRKVYENIKYRINDAKVGVLNVHGNYSIISGDLYALAQSMFGLPVTGILPKGTIYSNYWRTSDVKQVICFRAPMSCHSNIRNADICDSDSAAHWFRYMTTCTVLNAWDTTWQALNGCDADGDLLFTTDNPVLLRNTIALPALMCEQKKAEKVIPTEKNLIESNISGFGDDIGKITNRITSMYTIRSAYGANTEEYKILSYRINCGQLLQQNAIDKIKGIQSKPMPREWYDRLCLDGIDENKVNLHYNIVADKKPYFMIYIYPDLKKQYRDYLDSASRQCRQQYKIELDELLGLREDLMTDAQAEWVKYYYAKIPVKVESCVMNRICRRIEREFDGYIKSLTVNKTSLNYDYSALIPDVKYSSRQYYAVKKIHEEYAEKISLFMSDKNSSRVNNDESVAFFYTTKQWFRRACYSECCDSDTTLRVVYDITIKNGTSTKFMWDVLGSEMIERLLTCHDMIIRYPVKCLEGEILYGGEPYSICEQQIQLEVKQ